MVISFVSRKSAMEEVLLRFSHLGEYVFDQLDNKSFARCRIVSKSWKSFVDDEQLPFRIIKNEPGLQKKDLQVKIGNSLKMPRKKK